MHVVTVQIIIYAMRPTLSYAVLEAGAPPAFLGAISAAFAVPGLLLAIPAGHAIDRVGERLLLVLGPTAIVIAAALAMLAGSSVAQLVLATVLLGLGHLLTLVGQQAKVANSTPSGRFDSVFGLYTFSASLGQTLGPLLLSLPGATPETPPLAPIFAVSLGLALSMLALSAFMRSSASRRSLGSPGMLATAGSLLRTRGLPQSLVATSIVLSSLDIFLAYLPALGHERGISAAAVSVMLVTRSVFSMLSRLFLGRMVGALGRRNVLVWSIGSAAIMLSGVALPLPFGWLVVLCAAYGFVIGVCQPITMSWVSDLAPPGTRGLAMSMRLASNRLGQSVLPAVVGVIAAATGAAGVLVGTGALLAGAAFSSSVVPDKPPTEEDRAEA